MTSLNPQDTNNDTTAARRGVLTRVIKAMAAETFGNAVLLIVQVGSVPLFIHFWGNALYGEWLLLSTIPSYFAMSDLGFASAAGNAMTMQVASGDKNAALRTFQSAWLLVTALSAFLTLLSIVLLNFLPVGAWFHIVSLEPAQVKVLLVILALQFFFALQRQQIALGYRSDGNYAIGTMVASVKRLFDFLVMAIVLIAGGGPVVVAAAYLIAEMFSNVLVACDVRRRSPWLEYGVRYADKQTVQGLIRPALSFMGFPLGHALGLQGMLTIVGFTLGPTAVVLFSTMRTLTRGIAQVLSSVTAVVWVELSTAFGSGNIELARSLHRRASQVSLWLCFLFCALLLPVGQLIFRYWTQNKVNFDPFLFLLLLIVIVCNSFWSASHIVSLAANRHGRVALTFVIASTLSLAAAVVLTRLIGIYGAAVSLLLIDLAMILFVVPQSLKMVQDDLPSYAKSVLVLPLDLPHLLLRRIFRRRYAGQVESKGTS